MVFYFPDHKNNVSYFTILYILVVIHYFVQTRFEEKYILLLKQGTIIKTLAPRLWKIVCTKKEEKHKILVSLINPVFVRYDN